jgi:general secretion pathway protein G
MSNEQLNPLALRLKAVRRAAIRGVTLIEVLIVVAIMALIAGGVGIAILPKWEQAKVDTATTSAREIRKVAIQYMALKSNGDCPSMQTLISEKEIDSEVGSQDPWGQDWEITCSSDDVSVSSPGSDKQPGTEDDIIAGSLGES